MKTDPKLQFIISRSVYADRYILSCEAKPRNLELHSWNLNGMHALDVIPVMKQALLHKWKHTQYIPIQNVDVICVLWAVRRAKESLGNWKNGVRALAKLFTTTHARAETILRLNIEVLYLAPREGAYDTRDISSLDPASTREEEASWGYLTYVADKCGATVRAIVNAR